MINTSSIVGGPVCSEASAGAAMGQDADVHPSQRSPSLWPGWLRSQFVLPIILVLFCQTVLDM